MPEKDLPEFILRPRLPERWNESDDLKEMNRTAARLRRAASRTEAGESKQDA